MSDLISRKAVFDALIEKGQSSKRYKLGENWELNLPEIIDAINAIPSAEPERKTGEWTEKEVFTSGKGKIREWQSAKCSVCGKYHTTPYLYYFGDYNFCPMCGAEMRGDR